MGTIHKLILDKYKTDPLKFLVDVLGVPAEYIWNKMREICVSVRDNRNTAVKAAHACSKSYTAARLALWFLYCFPPATVITTAPSNTQVVSILWREIRNAHAKAVYPLGGKVTNTQLDLGEKWFATGFATRPDQVTQQATRFQGFHNDNVLVIFDEAAGIEREIWEAKDALMTSGHVRFLAIGNPTAATGDFVNCFKDSSFSKITISVFDTPNYIEGKEVIPGLSGREYAADIERKYGITSNYYKARVLGEIPSEDADALIPLSWIEKSEQRDSFPFPYTRKYLVWDVADGGEDSHEISAWENLTQVSNLTLRQKTVEEAESYVWRELRKFDGKAIIVDADGVGRVAIGLLKAAADPDTQVIPFEGSSTETRDPAAFSHRYSEGHWAMRKAFEENKISIPADPELREEIAAVRLDNTTNRHTPYIVVEKKKYLKERIGRSPGKKDCVMMACAEWDRVRASTVKPDRYKAKQVEYQLHPDLA